MATVLVLGGGLLLLLVFLFLIRVSGGTPSRGTSPEARRMHRLDGDSHIYYWNGDSLVHESDACWGCMENRYQELTRAGVEIDEVIHGRRHSGGL